MANTISVPNISNWTKVGNELHHKFHDITAAGLIIISVFVDKHKNYYICNQEGNNLTLCKREVI